MSATQQLIEIDHISEENAPAVYVQNGLKPFLQMIKDEVCGEVPDLTTRKGRERIASLSAIVSKRKAAVEKPGRDYLRKIKELPKVIEQELKQFVDEANALRDEIRKPLTDWEAAEKARKDRQVDAVQAIADFAVDLSDAGSSKILESIASVEAVQMGAHWEEFEPDAARTKDQVLTALRAALAVRQKQEADQADLERLRAEAEAQAQRDREAEIARAAAERARIEAEQRAQAERDAAIKREADAKAAADRRELELKLAAEQAERAAAQAAREKIESEQRAAQQKIDDERRHQQALEQAEANRVAAEQRAEQERQAAELRQKQAVEQARLDEIARVNAAADEINRQAAAREADKAHKAKINGAALRAFIEGGMPEECARQAVVLIAQRKIPNIAITY